MRPNPRSHCRYQGQLVKPKPGFLSAPWCVTGSSLYWQKYGIFLLLKGTLFPLEGMLPVLPVVESSLYFPAFVFSLNLVVSNKSLMVLQGLLTKVPFGKLRFYRH